MKKEYLKPEMTVHALTQHCQLLSGSNVVNGVETNIGDEEDMLQFIGGGTVPSI